MNESCRLDLGAQSWPGSVVQAAAGAPEDVKCDLCAGPQFVLFLGEEAELVDPSNTRTTPQPFQTASLTR